jgi:hypothetical protein
MAVVVTVDRGSVSVIVKGRDVIVGVAEGTNGGVGERIAGKAEGDTNGVLTAKGKLISSQAARKKIAVNDNMVLIMIASN